GFSIQGEAQIQRVIELARLLGLPGAQPAADGVAKVDMRLAGSWSGFAAPRAEGTAQLRAIRAEVPGTSAPIDIVSGQLTLTPQEATFDKLTATGAGGRHSARRTSCCAQIHREQGDHNSRTRQGQTTSLSHPSSGAGRSVSGRLDRELHSEAAHIFR